MTRAKHLLETSGLDVQPAETIPALAPQMQSPPSNDLHNNKGLDLHPGTNTMQGGWIVNDKPQSTQMRNAGGGPFSGMQSADTNMNPYSGHAAYDESRAIRIISLIREAQLLPPQQTQFSGIKPMTATPTSTAQMATTNMTGGMERAAKQEINNYLTKGRSELALVAAKRDTLAKNMAQKATM